MEGQHYLWLNDSAQRYYRLRLQDDLLGDLSLIRSLIFGQFNGLLNHETMSQVGESNEETKPQVIYG